MSFWPWRLMMICIVWYWKYWWLIVVFNTSILWYNDQYYCEGGSLCSIDYSDLKLLCVLTIIVVKPVWWLLTEKKLNIQKEYYFYSIEEKWPLQPVRRLQCKRTSIIDYDMIFVAYYSVLKVWYIYYYWWYRILLF